MIFSILVLKGNFTYFLFCYGGLKSFLCHERYLYLIIHQLIINLFLILGSFSLKIWILDLIFYLGFVILFGIFFTILGPSS